MKFKMSDSSISSRNLTVSSSTDKDPQVSSAFTSVGFIALVVVASLTMILGAVYAYIYYTRINPKANRARNYSAASSGDDGNGSTKAAHMLLFRKV